jgi:hypothetical protein
MSVLEALNDLKQDATPAQQERIEFVLVRVKNIIAKIGKFNSSGYYDDLQIVVKELDKPEWRNGTRS